MTYGIGPNDRWYEREEPPLDDDWPTDVFPAVNDGLDDESPYPRGMSLTPLIMGVMIILTFWCWWLAYYSPKFVNGLLFGLVAPFCVWAFGLRLARGPAKVAENAFRVHVLRALDKPLQSSPRRIGGSKLPHEKLLFYSRRHPISILGKKHPWAGALATLVVAGLAVLMLRLGQPLVAGGVVLAALPIAAFQYFGWRNEWFWFTNFRIVRSFGIVRKTTKMIPKAKVDSINFNTPGTARLLARLRFIWVAYGDILIETADDELPGRKQDENPRIQEMKFLAGAAYVTMLAIEWNQSPADE